MQELAATGFRDMSRLAGGRPVLSEQIVRTNLDAIHSWLDRYERVLAEVRRAVSEQPDQLRPFFEQAHTERIAWKAGWDARAQG
jgi:prephenate dehydrogenase